MKRGDIYRVDWETSVKGEPAFSRPAVVLTNDEANLRLLHLVVAPLTTNVERLYPFDLKLPAGSCGLKEASKVQLNYIRDLNRNRLSTYLGHIPQPLCSSLMTNLKSILGFRCLSI
jgi:mRNA interferase MazF